MVHVNARIGERRRAATQLDLLEATTRLLEQGTPITALTIDQIVKAAGVVRTTFYLHFRDKQELLETLADDQVLWLENLGQGAQTDPELTRDTVRGVMDEITTQWVANHAVLSAIIEFAEYDDRMHAQWTAAMRHVAAVALELFSRFWESSGQTPPHPERVAEALTWMIERCCHQIARDPAARPEIADSMAEIIWRVLHPLPGRSG